MQGHVGEEGVRAHADSHAEIAPVRVGREVRESVEAETLSPGATLAHGGGNRGVPEEPDPDRTCFERDRDRIIHSTAFRRLAGKTQVVVYPRDHQRTRLTHALEVAQVATAIARGIGANATLAEAMALGHDCGHGPGGHASEDAFSPFIPGGYDHGPWGADVVLAPLNLCLETYDAIRNHSWSRPAPATPEGEIVSWADRIAYCCHDLEDALGVGIVTLADIPREVAERAGTRRSAQLRTFITSVIESTQAMGQVSMGVEEAAALADLRQFNYDRIYMRPESLAQSQAVIEVLQALVEWYIAHPSLLPSEDANNGGDNARRAVTYVAGMTDRFAFSQAESLMDWDMSRLPVGMGRGV
ncbi:MAG: HD domain-containing protein [Propionibacteriaceae bacterium]|jgi:dGTPase|nr:HD domain-containing protein [Propionibacteriaceae bacterium]